MLGVLTAILHLDFVAVSRRLVGKHNVALVVPAGIASSALLSSVAFGCLSRLAPSATASSVL